MVAHLHLLLNHIPTVGTVVGVAVFMLALVRRRAHLATAALEILFVVAVMTLPAYVTGAGALVLLQEAPGVSEVALAAHRDAAFVAFLLMQVTGAVAWYALWHARRTGSTSRGAAAVAFVLSVTTLVLMANVGNLGGAIRHPEIVAGPGGAVVHPSIDVGALGQQIVAHLWVWPALETLHFVGMSLSFGVLLVVNIHLLGFMPRTPFRAVHMLLPWGMLGIAVNVTTGMLFFTGNPQQYMENPTFHWKVVLLVPAALNYLFLTVVDESWLTTAGGHPHPVTRIVAVSSLCLWVGVLYLGRLLPYLRGVLS